MEKVTMATIAGLPQGAARFSRSEDLLNALDPIACDYAATLMLTRGLPPADARRCQQKARGRYARLLRQTTRSVEWLTTDAPAGS